MTENGINAMNNLYVAIKTGNWLNVKGMNVGRKPRSLLRRKDGLLKTCAHSDLYIHSAGPVTSSSCHVKIKGVEGHGKELQIYWTPEWLRVSFVSNQRAGLSLHAERNARG